MHTALIVMTYEWAGSASHHQQPCKDHTAPISGHGEADMSDVSGGSSQTDPSVSPPIRIGTSHVRGPSPLLTRIGLVCICCRQLTEVPFSTRAVSVMSELYA